MAPMCSFDCLRASSHTGTSSTGRATSTAQLASHRHASQARLPSRCQLTVARVAEQQAPAAPPQRTPSPSAAAVQRVSTPTAPQLRCLSPADAPTVVSDIMTSRSMFTMGPDNTVDEALRVIVNHRVSGLPVIDNEGHVVGVVSDFDLLNLDHVLQEEEQQQAGSMFPEVGKSWRAFNDIKVMLSKTGGKLVSEVMTQNPYTVKQTDCIDDAARLMMTKRVRRLPVVDSEGRLVGILSRGNIVKSVLQQHEAAKLGADLEASA